MTPSDCRSAQPDTTIRYVVAAASLGSILVAQSGRGICAILLGGDPQLLVRDLQDRFPGADPIPVQPAPFLDPVLDFVEGSTPTLDLPLDIRGTRFQQRVWQALRVIPAGSRVSYYEIARRLGQPTASRAVARACAANALAVVIPCHRVVRKDGGLAGYRWGVERKRALLAREAQG
jgi:AraC family transcriptional regulator of adaptative response/methylated-DNA-[protein]-cysteine methyltransferase